MKILIIDGMGGGMGKAAVEIIKTEIPSADIIAVGTNSTATAAMLKAGANNAATGENAVIYNSQNCDFIIGAIGIVFGNSMYGEISPKMAEAVSSSMAYKLLIPTSKCNAHILGTAEKGLGSYLNELVDILKQKI